MAEVMLVNPAKRRRTKRKTTKRRKNPTRKTVARRSAPVVQRRRRRNPTQPRIMTQITNAAVGAGGALAVDLAMANLPIPATFTATPMMRSATQGAVSLTIGMLIANFSRNKQFGRQIAEGGLTVALHGFAKGAIGPTMGLSGYGDGSLLGYGDGSLLGYEDLAWINPAGAQDFPGYDDLGAMAYDQFDEFEF